MMLAGLLEFPVWIALWCVPVLGLCSLCYFLVSLPMRRQKRADLFLDLLELGLKDGRNVERAIVSAARSRDRSLGVRFHLLAAHLEAGVRLDQALQRVPSLLPPQVAAMLKVGAEIGDVGRVLPACRRLLKDSSSQVQGGTNYLLVPSLGVVPVLPMIVWMLMVYTWPRFEQIYQDMFDGSVPMPGAWLRSVVVVLPFLYSFLVLVIYGLAVAYVGGPRVRRWGYPWLYPLTDRVNLWLPWRRKRLYRDFATMLAMVLDVGAPEVRAVQLAGECTSNRVFQQRVASVIRQLQAGVPLTEALSRMDDTGEFRWRMENARHRQGGFMAALSGWFDALEAKAFQQEQTAAQTFTTAVVLVNGAVVGVIAITAFMILTTLIQQGVLW